MSLCTNLCVYYGLYHLSQVGMKNSDYLSVFFHILLPVAYEVSLLGNHTVFWRIIINLDIYCELILCHSFALTWFWYAQVLTQLSVTQRCDSV